MKIDPLWQNYATKHVLDVGVMNSPSDIADFMRKHKIKSIFTVSLINNRWLLSTV